LNQSPLQQESLAKATFRRLSSATFLTPNEFAEKCQAMRILEDVAVSS